MLRITMLLIALLAIVAVLWASWQLNRKLFTPALILVLVALGMFATGIWQSSEEGRQPIDPARIVVDIEDSRGMEEGVRLRGWIENGSKAPLSHLRGRALRVACPEHDSDVNNGNGECQIVAEAPFTLRRHVPAGAKYTWSTIIRMPAALLNEGNDWRIEVEEVTGFHSDSD